MFLFLIIRPSSSRRKITSSYFYVPINFLPILGDLSALVTTFSFHVFQLSTASHPATIRAAISFSYILPLRRFHVQYRFDLICLLCLR
jgi:hypothetical protein